MFESPPNFSGSTHPGSFVVFASEMGGHWAGIPSGHCGNRD